MRRPPGRRWIEASHVTRPCQHLEPAIMVDPPLDVCSSCVEIGGSWVHLRQCLVCGRTGCCNQSPNRHATAHFHQTGHPTIRSAEPDETWQWCYLDDQYYVPDDGPEAGNE
jgi:uncharacterized UBP type Zn finger protein